MAYTVEQRESSDDRGAPGTSYARRGLELIASYGDTEAIVARDGRRFTYRQVHAEVTTLAARLWRHGIRPGAALGVLVSNPAEGIFLQLAAHLLGCRTAWTAHSTPEYFRRDFIGFAELDAFIYDARAPLNLGHGSGALGELGREMADAAAPLPVFCFGPGGAGPDLLDGPLETELPFDPAAVTASPQSLYQTSGTTGTPKLVHHRHDLFLDMLSFAERFASSDAPRLRHLVATGCWHVGAQTADLMTLFSGGLLVMVEGVTNEIFLRTVERERISSSLLSPAMLYSLLDDPLLDDVDMSSLRSLTISAAPASPARLAQAIDRFGPVLRIVYGMSEVPFITALPDLDHVPGHPQRLASCGRAWPGMRVEVRDDAGGDCEPGIDGEVFVAGPYVMGGYWRMPELTRQTLVGGWLATGDIGHFDEEGYLYLVDRAKDMIITSLGGVNIFCRPVEDALATHPHVRAAAVIGVPDDEVGEVVHAYVQTIEGATVTADDLRAHVVARLNELWAPRTVDFLDDFPLTGFGKVDKKALRSRHLATARGGVDHDESMTAASQENR